MAIVKNNESITRQPPMIVLFGEPGSGKTSISFTTKNCLLFDFDRGATRCIERKDTFVASSFAEVLQSKSDWIGYNTYIIDTAKSLLDDFIKDFVCERDYQLASQKNMLRRYGVILDEFNAFVKELRKHGTVIILCHVKTNEESKRKEPDITGSSYQAIVRQADMIGYIDFQNQQRVLDFNPTDTRIGKNTTQLPRMVLPTPSEASYPTFMQDIIDMTNDKLANQTEAQRQAAQLQTELLQRIDQSTPVDWKGMLEKFEQLPTHLKIPLQHELSKYIIDFVGKVDDVELINSIIDVLNAIGPKTPIGIEGKKAVLARADVMKWVLNTGTKKFEVKAETPDKGQGQAIAPTSELFNQENQ